MKNIYYIALTKTKIMRNETQSELFDILYTLEVTYEYDKTKMGIRIGTLIDKLNKELL